MERDVVNLTTPMRGGNLTSCPQNGAHHRFRSIPGLNEIGESATQKRCWCLHPSSHGLPPCHLKETAIFLVAYRAIEHQLLTLGQFKFHILVELFVVNIGTNARMKYRFQ